MRAYRFYSPSFHTVTEPDTLANRPVSNVHTGESYQAQFIDTLAQVLVAALTSPVLPTSLSALLFLT